MDKDSTPIISKTPLVFSGKWNPILKKLPAVSEGSPCRYWTIVDDGSIEGTEYSKDTYLVWDRFKNTFYIHPHRTAPVFLEEVAPEEESGEPANWGEDALRRAVTPIFLDLVRTVFEQDPHSHLLFEFDEATQTMQADVRIDGTSIVPDAFNQLTAVGRVDLCGGITADMITDWCEAFYKSFLFRFRSSFNNPRVNSVQFKYNETIQKIEADVKIDGITIVRNRDGQLVSVAQAQCLPEHTHVMADITDWREQTPAPDQLLTVPSIGVWSTGFFDLEGYAIRDAFSTINIKIKDLDERVTDLEKKLGGVLMTPRQISSVSLDVNSEINPSRWLVSVVSQEPAEVFTDAMIETTRTPRFEGGVGTLQLYLNDSSIGSIDFDQPDRPKDDAWDSLIVFFNGDFYRDLAEDNPALYPFIGQFNGLEVGARFQLPAKSGTNQIWLDQNGSLSRSTFFEVEPPVMSADLPPLIPVQGTSPRFVSGVPSWRSNRVTLDSFDVYSNIKNFYDPDVLVEIDLPLHTGPDGGLTPASLIGHNPNQLPTKTEYSPDFLNSRTAPLEIHFEDRFVFKPDLTVRVLNNARDVIATRSYVLDQVNMDDSTLESSITSPYRSLVKTQEGRFVPDLTPYGASSPVSLIDLPNELQLFQNRIVYPSMDFGSLNGPDYRGITGKRWFGVVLSAPEFRSITIPVDFDRSPTYVPFSKRIVGIEVLLAVQTPEWVVLDANSEFRGTTSTVLKDGWGCLDNKRTTETSLVLTLGSRALSREIILVVGFDEEFNNSIGVDFEGVVFG